MVGTRNASLQAGERVERPANSSATLNFMPHFRQENAILGLTTGALVASKAGTTSGSLHPEQVVLRPANSGVRLYALRHWGQEKEIIILPCERLRIKHG